MNPSPLERPGLLRRCLSYWFRLEDFKMPHWEVMLLRVFLALLIWDTHTGWIGFWNQPSAALHAILHNAFGADITYATQPHPNGFATWFDLTFLSNDAVEGPLRLLTAISLVLYAIGVASEWSLAIPTLFGLAAATLNNSQGSIGHTAQGLHLVLLMLWLSGIYSRIRGHSQSWVWGSLDHGRREMSWARQGLAAAYVVSAITKVVNSHGLWFANAQYFSLHLLKNNGMEYHDRLDPSALKMDWLPQVLMEHPLACQFLFGIALPLELFAFLGLRNRRAAALFGIGLIAFHETVTLLTNLSFILNKALLLALFINPIWWICAGIRRAKGEKATIGEQF